MTTIERFGLPRELGDGLVLRWATAADAENVARFNVEMHSDNPEEPDMGLHYWVLDLMRGDHPTTKPGDFTAKPYGTASIVREIGIIPGHSWRAAGRFVVRRLRQEADTLNESRPPEKRVTNIHFNLGEGHPLYEALDPDLEKQIHPYAWYIRVPDIPAFLRHVAPALERRLAGSVMAGHTGTLKINLYRSRFTLVWENGRLKEVGDGYGYKRLEEGDAAFPDLTFLQLLFGHRNIDELTHSFADCFIDNNEALVLLRVLFPKRPSRVVPLG